MHLRQSVCICGRNRLLDLKQSDRLLLHASLGCFRSCEGIDLEARRRINNMAH